MEKLDNRTKWTYCIGATGRDMAYALVSMFLINYIQYTMKLTVTQFAAIAAIVVVCMIWDAINDPLMGIIIENCHFKMGKYRPWILVGSILNAIIIILLFSLRPTGWGFVIFFGLGYLSWGMTYTMNDIAYWGMLPSLSSDPKERNFLVTVMGIFICVGQFTVAGIVPTIIAGNAINTYKIVALIVGLCFILFQLLTVIGVKERYHSAEENVEHLGLKDMFKIFARNDQLISAGLASLFFNIGGGLLIMFGMNFFYFEFGYSKGGDLVFVFTVMYGLGTIISEFLFPLLVKIFKRKILFNFFSIFSCTCYLLFFGVGYIPFFPKNPVFINVLGFLIFFSQGVLNMLIIVMLNNTIEYDELKFNERHDSIISTVRSFSAKLSGAINQGVVNLTLIISGIYTISQNVSDLEQKAGAGEISREEVLRLADGYIQSAGDRQLFTLRTGISLVPLVAIGACLFIINEYYKIDEERYDQIVALIKQRESSAK